MGVWTIEHTSISSLKVVVPADLACGEADVLVPNDDLQLLPTNSVGLRPKLVVLRHDLGVFNDPPQLVHNSLRSD